MKVLILGSKGQLGRCLNAQLSNEDNEVIYSTRDFIDITNFKATTKSITEIAPDVIINAAAYTAVDKAEDSIEEANLINNLAIANISFICKKLNCNLIHISTDYVFDGTSTKPYLEDNITNPQSIYGKTKLKGELAIKTSGCSFVIIRTAWVYSEYGNNFLKTMLSLGADRERLSVVGDQIGCPTYAQDIAKVINRILQRLNENQSIYGLYHFVGDTGCSWAEFAEDIFSEAIKQDILKNKPKVIRVASSEFPAKAMRPMHSRLDCSKLTKVIGIKPSSYSSGIHSAIKKLQLHI